MKEGRVVLQAEPAVGVDLAALVEGSGQERLEATHRTHPTFLSRIAGPKAFTTLAATRAPVPGFADRSARLDVTELHPWLWLVRPREAPLRSFSAWRKAVGNPR